VHCGTDCERVVAGIVSKNSQMLTILCSRYLSVVWALLYNYDPCSKMPLFLIVHLYQHHSTGLVYSTRLPTSEFEEFQQLFCNPSRIPIVERDWPAWECCDNSGKSVYYNKVDRFLSLVNNKSAQYSMSYVWLIYMMRYTIHQYNDALIS
jgi:hypothetical protein